MSGLGLKGDDFFSLFGLIIEIVEVKVSDLDQIGFGRESVFVNPFPRSDVLDIEVNMNYEENGDGNPCGNDDNNSDDRSNDFGNVERVLLSIVKIEHSQAETDDESGEVDEC